MSIHDECNAARRKKTRFHGAFMGWDWYYDPGMGMKASMTEIRKRRSIAGTMIAANQSTAIHVLSRTARLIKIRSFA